MANTSRHIDLAVADSMETEEEAQKLIRMLRESRADGHISWDDTEAIYKQAQEVLREASEDVLAVERANVAELVTASILKQGTCSPYLLKRARDVGLDVAIPIVALPAVETTERITA